MWRTLSLAWSSFAWAQDSQAQLPTEPLPIASDVAPIQVKAHLDQPIESVRAQLADGATAMQLGNGVLAVTAHPQGNCELLEVTTRGLFSPLHYTSIRCPTERGWTSRLTGSEDFEVHEVEWLLSPSGGGTDVTMTIQVQTTFPVPEALQRRVVASSLAGTLDALESALRIAGDELRDMVPTAD